MEGQIQWLEPWDELCTPAESFEKQLNKELGINHILYGLKATAIARRYDCDKILFEIKSDDFLYAVVHLSYSKTSFIDYTYPRTKTFKSFDDFFEECMSVDHHEFDS